MRFCDAMQEHRQRELFVVWFYLSARTSLICSLFRFFSSLSCEDSEMFWSGRRRQCSVRDSIGYDTLAAAMYGKFNYFKQCVLAFSTLKLDA
jgi:hypothetical protein